MWWRDVDHLLRRRGETPEGRDVGLWRRAAIMLICACGYGVVMGLFGGIRLAAFHQALLSATKMPLLLAGTFALSLPSFFVLNTLLGLRADFPLVLSALAGAQAVLTLILASLAPLTALWYVSVRDYSDALLFNAFIFAFASTSAQLSLRRSFLPLIARRPLHRWTLRCWLIIYGFVGIQMGWALRPFIGQPDLPVRFFRHDALSNAYVVVAHLIVSKL